MSRRAIQPPHVLCVVLGRFLLKVCRRLERTDGGTFGYIICGLSLVLGVVSLCESPFSAHLRTSAVSLAPGLGGTARMTVSSAYSPRHGILGTFLCLYFGPVGTAYAAVLVVTTVKPLPMRGKPKLV